VASLAPPYVPRRPTETVLYRVVRESLDTFVAHARETYERPLPRYVENELRAYLRCGVFSYGFIRCHCDACGHDLLVAFSCKGRGVCPSCAGRRMANTGAHLVDRVVPDVPVRQFVLSLPHELRMLAAFKPDVLTALSRIFVEEVFRNYRQRAERHGIDAGEGGAVTLVQRFGGSLNLNVHYHVVFLDGVFTRDGRSRVQFHPAPPPESGDLTSIVQRVHKRAVAWLRRRGYVDARAPEDGLDPTPQSAIEACAAIAMKRGTFAPLPNAESPETADAPDAPRVHLAVEHEGWNLHAGVHIAAGDDLSRERLLRYGARPALAMDRLRRLPDGRIAFRVKYSRGRSKHRLMTPLELMARLAAIIPPPRYPLVRFHGVLGPRSSWRKDVVPKPRGAVVCTRDETKQREPRRTRRGRGDGQAPPPGRANADARDSATPAESTSPGTAASIAPSPPPSLPESLRAQTPTALATQPLPAAKATFVAPNVLSVAHWNRLAGGELYAAAPRMAWGPLLRRTFDVDVQECPKCHGRLRLIAAIIDPPVARAILASLDMPITAPVPSRARDPTELFELEPSEPCAP
jgi:hypothetical protein